jgi:hypothetical protein
MALGFKNGTDNLLFAKIGTPLAGTPTVPTWVVIGCLKTNGWEGSTDTIDTTSKCSGKYKTALPGDITWSFNAEFNDINDTPTTAPVRASFAKLAALHKAGTTFPMKMVGVDTPLDIIRGDVFITAISKSAARNEAVNSSVTFMGVDEYFLTDEA